MSDVPAQVVTPEHESFPAPPASATTTEAPTASPPMTDPKVAQLQSLFPDTDTTIVEAVLSAHAGSVEGAMEDLLAMSDPTYKPSQIDTDEQMARDLAAQDRAQLQQQRQQAPAPAATRTPGPITYQPYTPRRRQAQGQTPQGQGQGAIQSVHGEQPKDELDQLSENFSKLAEQGKRTLTNLFGKVKEQINKVDTGASGSSSGSQPLPPLPTSQTPNAPSSTVWQAPTALPRPDSSNTTTQPTPSPQLVPERSTLGTALTPPPKPVEKGLTTEAASSTSEAASSPSDEPKKDFSKIGFLPKQSISLLDKPKKKDGDKDEDSEDEDLEYVKSPFDDD